MYRDCGEEQYLTRQGKCVYLEVFLLGRGEVLCVCVHKRDSVPWPTAKGVCGDVGGMKEAKSIEIPQVHEVELDNRGEKTPALGTPDSERNDGAGGCILAVRLHL